MLILSTLFEVSIHELLKVHKKSLEPTTAYELVKIAKKHGIVEKNKKQEVELKPGEYKVPTKGKDKKFIRNPFTGRMKNKKLTKYIKTEIAPEKRTFKNKPDNVRFQDWLLIKANGGLGKSAADNKWYGWSHRAVSGFRVGDTVKPGTCGFDHIKKPFKIKSDTHAKEVAKRFHNGVS
jgi:hypothetical protein